jgi:hypothetical protein
MIWGVLIRDVRSEALYIGIYLLCTYLGGACEIAKGTTVLSRPFETGAAGPLLLLLVFPASVDHDPGLPLTRTESHENREPCAIMPALLGGREKGRRARRQVAHEGALKAGDNGLGLAAGGSFNQMGAGPG